MTTARKNGSGWTVELQTGVQANGLSGDWSAPLAGLTLKLGAYIDIMGSLSVFADASGRVTEHTSAGAQLAMGMSGALTLKLFVARLGQRLTLPVLMTPDLNPSVIFFSTVLPAAGYAAAYRYWLLPRKHARIRDRVHELQREHKEYTAQKRAEAEEAQLAMERVAESRRDTERRRNGLVILDAKYGRADAFTPRGYREANDDEGFPVIVDVTTSVQMLVVDSRLYVPAGRAKHGLNGFYDPCIGENKRLRVRYLFRGKTHEVTVDDIGSLLAPVQAHALDE